MTKPRGWRSASDGLLDDAVDLEPLLSDAGAGLEDGDAATDLPRAASSRSPAAARKRVAPWKILLAALAIVLLMMHLLFVALLRKTSFSLDQLTIPDLCHAETTGEVVVEFQNPSYCAPLVGPTVVTLEKNGTALLTVSLPHFQLRSGVSTVVADVDIRMFASAQTLYQLAIADEGAFDVVGAVPIQIGCLLVPFTVNVDVARLVGTRLSVHNAQESTNSPSELLQTWIDTWDPFYPSAQLQKPAPRGIINAFTSELQRVVAQILKTIVLSNFQVETFKEEIFAFTDVSFDYASRVLWNIPSLSIRVQSEARQTILLAGMKRFLLGGGDTFISAYTEVFKSQSAPLQSMLATYLAGHDIALYVSGRNPATECFSLQVLDLVDVKVDIPAKIDGKPALLRHYEIHPTLKELDSKARKCLLELKVLITVNNPLPIRFDLYEIEFDLLYKDIRPSLSPLSPASLPPSHAEKLVHILDTKHVQWSSHEHHNVTLSAKVRRFEACERVVQMYFHNSLAFEIRHGNIAVGAGSGNLSIPFSVNEIPIHPGIMQGVGEYVGEGGSGEFASEDTAVDAEVE